MFLEEEVRNLLHRRVAGGRGGSSEFVSEFIDRLAQWPALRASRAEGRGFGLDLLEALDEL